MNNPFTPSSDDAAVEMLRMIFGRVMDGIIAGNTQTASSATANMLGEAFRFFNSGVLFFGTVILLWVTVFGITNTANDGEALGKKWSTFYTPLRTLVSAATLIPTGSGYAGIQIILLTIVCYSVGFASNLWKSVVQYAVAQNVASEAVKSITNDPNFESVATNALRMHLCAVGVNAAVNATTAGTSVNLQIQKVDSSAPISGGGTTYKTRIFYKDPAWPSSETICGQIELSDTFTPSSSRSNATTQVVNSLQDAIANIRYRYVTNLFNANSVITPLAAAAARAAISQDSTQTIDSQVVANVVTRFKQNYLTEIAAEVSRQLQNDNNNVADKLSSKGWVFAGSLYSELSSIKDAVRNASKSESNFIAGTGTLNGVLSGDVGLAANNILNQYNIIGAEVARRALDLQAKVASATPKMPVIQSNFSEVDFSADSGTAYKASVTSWFNSLPINLMSGAVHYLGDPDQDPVMKVKNLGDWMSTSAATIMVTKAAITTSLATAEKAADESFVTKAFSKAIPAIPASLRFLSTFVSETWSNLSPSIFTILYTGYFLGIWVPMIPSYIFMLGVAGWLIFVGEMLAAGVLWMAAHTTPAREDSFIGSQAQGYLLVMSGFFRPALMVLGMVFSMAILNPLVQFLNEGFIVAVRSIQADSFTGLFSFAGFMLGYCFMIFSVFMLVFSLPQTFPDRILKWVGAGIGDMGEQSTAQRLENAASTQARTAAVAGAAKYSSGEKEKLENRKRDSSGSTDMNTQLSLHAPEGFAGQSTALAQNSESPSSAEHRDSVSMPEGHSNSALRDDGRN